ncbi:hypothetical protein EDB83DRAFT_2531108 [Lactarius deliciosus]|nr:hypothetical protein EDB83DRAFT_2531108 [Lactarius deliciosus]
MSHNTFRSWSFSQLKPPLRRPQSPNSRLPPQPANHGPRGHPPPPLPLSLLKSLIPMTLSLVTGTAREPAATPLRLSRAPHQRLSCCGRPIPSDGRVRGLRLVSTHGRALTSDLPATAPHCPPSTMRPLMRYGFEIVAEPAISTGAYIMEEADSDTALAAPSKITLSASSTPCVVDTLVFNRPDPSNFACKLNQVTLAHLTVILQIHNELIETAYFERADDAPGADTVARLGFATKQEARFSLPLRKIDVLDNDHSTGASALGRGSQIVAIHEDLANEVGARVNMWRTEGANGSTSAKDLDMHISYVSFTIYAHVV